MLIGIFPIANLDLKASAASYNASAAVDYAKTYVNYYNSNYNSYKGKGGDCANFVSQCLYAGGLQTDATWKPDSYAWINVWGLYSYLTSKNYSVSYDTASAEKGDVVIYANSSATYGHATICVESGSKVASHTDDGIKNITYMKLTCVIKMHGSVPPSAPTYARLLIDKYSHAKDEVVTFTCETDGAINNLWIYCPDGSPLMYQDFGTKKEITFGWIGHYRALVQTWTGEENIISDIIDFVIGAPTYAELYTDRTSYAKDEIVTFTANCDGDINNLWIYCPDGSPLMYQDFGTKKEITFGWIGHYRALVQTWNAYGNVISSLIDFVIGPPTYSKLTSDKNTYKTNETATFYCDTDGDLNTVWIYYPDGHSNYFWNIGKSVQTSFDNEGQYQALVQTWNESGNLISERISFIVADNHCVEFEPINGVCDLENKSVTYQSSYGELPKPIRTGYVFDGWYTAAEGGTLVTSDTIVTATEDHTLYAHWSHDTFIVKSGNLNIENKMISGGELMNMSAGDLKGNFDNTNVFVSMKSESRMATGTTVNLIDDTDEIYDTMTVVIFGDVNSDGWYDGTDALIVNCLANGLLTREQVGEAVYMAADCNHDGVITADDVTILEQAGVLLANVDQTKSEEELQTDSVYREYINLIDQNPTAEEEITEEPTHEPTAPTAKTFFDRIIEFFRMILDLIRSITVKF